MELNRTVSVRDADAFHREQLSREFRAARESAATVRRMLSLVSSRRRDTARRTTHVVPTGR